MKPRHYIFIALLIFSVDSFGQITPCTDYVCDSLAVRAILDVNGLNNTPVDNVSIIQNQRIKYLRLENSQITSLPPEIGKLTALTRLHLESNQLTSIPSEIGNPKHYMEVLK